MIAKERVIFDNYEPISDEELIEVALECGWVEDKNEITDNMLFAWRCDEEQIEWDQAWEEIAAFFKGKTVGFFGSVGLWNGVYNAGDIGKFEDLFHRAVTDCGYIKFYDENGHLYLKCSHHDGTCHFEIKEVTDKGTEYLANWEENWNDQRSEEYVHKQIYKRYSTLPNFAHKVYGCKAREFEPESREGFLRMLSNRAVSFYA